MQALIFTTLFGILLATTAGIVGVALDSSIQLMERQVRATHDYFRQVSFIMEEHILTDSMELPVLSLPEDIFTLEEVVKGVVWSGTSTTVDLWSEPFQVLTATQNLPVVSTPGGFVTATVQAFALMSSGPNRQFAPNTQAAMTDATDSIDDYRDVMNMSARADDDDIILTFNTSSAALNFWNRVDSSMDHLAGGIESYYTQELKNFNQELRVWLQNYYGTYGGSYVYDPITGSYSVDITDTAWLAIVDTKPTLVSMASNLRQVAQDVQNGLAIDPELTLYELPDPVGIADALNFLLVESGLTMVVCNASATVVGCDHTAVPNDQLNLVIRHPLASTWTISLSTIVNKEIEL